MTEVPIPDVAAVARATLLVFGHEGAHGDGSLERDLVAAAADLRGRLGAGGTVRVGVRLDDDPLAAIAASATSACSTARWRWTRPDVADLDGLIAALDGVGPAIAASVDLGASAAVAGTCHLVRAATGSVMLASAGRRRADVTRDAHSDWWLNHHGPMSMRLVPLSLGYQQLHADPDASRAAAKTAGVGVCDYDFGETAYFEAVESLIGPMSDPEIGRELAEDEARFIDHTSMIAAMCRLVSS